MGMKSKAEALQVRIYICGWEGGREEETCESTDNSTVYDFVISESTLENNREEETWLCKL